MVTDGLTLLQAVKEHVDLVVLDFDLTITKRHTGGHQRKSQLTPEYIVDNVYNVDHFVKFMDTVRELDIEVAIATFASPHWRDVGGQKLVTKYMDVILGKHRKVLTGAGDIQAWMPQYRNDKNLHLQFLVQRFGVLPRRTLLIDDDQSGYILQAAHQQGYLVAKVTTPGLGLLQLQLQ